MKLSRKWLGEFVDVADIPDSEFGHKMTMTGSIVESVESAGDAVTGVVIGRLDAIDQHPNADKLVVCTVDVGAEKKLTIATGAKNVKVGDIVPVATCGANLPGGHIEATDMRGVVSEGMLCSMDELGLDNRDLPFGNPNGILILNDPESDLPLGDYALGQDVRPLLGLDDRTAEFEITPNRPDCLSVIGLAREVSATFERPLTLHTASVSGGAGKIEEMLSVEVAEPELCPRYTARVVVDVKIAPSPAWMRERLRASGIRPINNIVDITNYVMLEYGQPMHSFDYSCLDSGKIVVRRAHAGEQLATLDSKPRTLTEDMLVIADSSKAVGVAGVMGGANSEITDATATVVFESANFSGPSVRRTAIALGMRTDASSRFEKGLDPENTIPAVDRACELVEMLGCGRVLDGIIDIDHTEYSPKVLPIEYDKINALLGTEISREFMRSALVRLGFGVDGDSVTVPSYRMDVEQMADLAEEVARMYGYDALPTTLCSGSATVGGLTERQKIENQTTANCRALGYSEVLTYSFVSPNFVAKLRIPEDSPLRRTLKILNPLGEDTSVMRTTALGSVLEAAAKNAAARVSELRVYELARVFRPIEGEKLPDERKQLLLCTYGADVDFYALKGDVEEILAGMRITGVRCRAYSEDGAFHPGRCAVVESNGSCLGTIGQIHPQVAEEFGINIPVYAAVLDYELMLESMQPEATFKPLPRFPSTSRDMAVVCDETLPAGDLLDCVRESAGELLTSAEIFDVYTGTGMQPGKKSIAMSLQFRSDERTLTDAEVDACFAAALAALEKKFGATLR